MLSKRTHKNLPVCSRSMSSGTGHTCSQQQLTGRMEKVLSSPPENAVEKRKAQNKEFTCKALCVNMQR